MKEKRNDLKAKTQSQILLLQRNDQENVTAVCSKKTA